MAKVKIEIAYKWEKVVDDSRNFVFINIKNIKEIKKMIGKEYDTPAVYKWVFGKKIYVGETNNLRNRIYQYGKPGKSQKTNEMINKFLKESIDPNFEIIKLNDIKLNGKLLRYKLESSFVRKFLENYLILEAIQNGDEIINQKSRKKD